jgi:hypothetical protein
VKLINRCFLVWRFSELFSIVGRPNVFSYGEIKSATGNFSPTNIVGRGGYGLVYKVSSISLQRRQKKGKFYVWLSSSKQLLDFIVDCCCPNHNVFSVSF